MNRPIKAKVGDQLRDLRQHAQLTQGELGAIAGLSQPHLSALERNEIRPDIDTLCRLADALQVDWGYDGERITFAPRGDKMPK